MVDRPGKNISNILTNHGHFGLFSASLKFERGRPRWILSDSMSTWKIQIVSKSVQNASNVSMWGGADRCSVKLQGTAYVSTLTYPLFLQWARGQVLLILPRIGRIRYWRKEVKKFVAFPGLTPLQPGGDVHPCKQACLTEPPHPSGLPLADGKPQNKIAAVGSKK